MTMANPFTDPAFNMTSLTASINILPNNYGRIREMDLFPGEGVATTTVSVERALGKLNLLPTKPRGADGTKYQNEKRDFRTFAIPHVPYEGEVLPDEYQNVRAFGSESSMAGLARVVNGKLQSMRNKHAITLEHMRMTALKGQMMDADGSIIYDWFNEFAYTQDDVDFQLDVATTPVQTKIHAVLRFIEDNLEGEVMSGVHAFVSEEFFDALIAHDETRETFLEFSGAQILRTDVRRQFAFGGIMFEEYRGKVMDPAGNVRRFLDPFEGIAFPIGTQDTFRTYFAPGDFLETANTIGIPVYAKQEPRQFNRGIDIHTQSNPLAICQRPKTLVRIHTPGP